MGGRLVQHLFRVLIERELIKKNYKLTLTAFFCLIRTGCHYQPGVRSSVEVARPGGRFNVRNFDDQPVPNPAVMGATLGWTSTAASDRHEHDKDRGIQISANHSMLHLHTSLAPIGRTGCHAGANQT